MKHGADVWLRDGFGVTPLELVPAEHRAALVDAYSRCARWRRRRDLVSLLVIEGLLTPPSRSITPITPIDPIRSINPMHNSMMQSQSDRNHRSHRSDRCDRVEMAVGLVVHNPDLMCHIAMFL